MRKYLQLFFKFMSLSWMSAMEYRANFISWTIIDIGWAMMDLLFMTVLINFTQSLGSWNLAQMLIVLGFFRLMVFPVWGWLFSSFSQLSKQISEGKLDFILAKPIDSQFMVSCKDFSFSVIPSVVTGSGFMVYGFHLLGYGPSLSSIIIFIWLTGVSMVLIYGLYFSIMALSLYVDRLNNIHHIFPSLYDASRYPSDIYSPFLKRILTTFLPISLIVTVPSQILFSTINIFELVMFHFMAVVFLAVGRIIWTNGLRRYSSASS